MRPRILACLVTLAVLVGGSATAQPAPAPLPVPHWDGQSLPTVRDLHSVHFHDAETGWVGADDGIVYRTTDGGRSWEARPTGLFHPVTIMDWIDDRRGWVGTVDLGIAATTDGGRTWEILHGGDMIGWFLDLTFVDHERGYASGQSGIFSSYLVRTSDGGATWEGLPLSYPFQEDIFRRVAVSSDEQTIWVLTWLFSDGDGISISRDGGDTWTFVPIAADRLADMAFTTDDVGVVVGQRGEIFRTTDGGETWIRAIAPPGPTLLDVEFVDESRGWAVGEAGTVLTTTDGGLTWTPEPSGAAATLSDATFLSTGRGWAAAADGELRHRSPTTGAEDVIGTVGTPPGDPRPPILVAGDEDFDSPLSGVRSGSGTAGDPYIIEGWDIVPVATDGITLAGTTAHVVIRDNRIHDAVGGGAGIRLVDSANVTIESNLIERTSQGVSVAAGGPVTIHDNDIAETAGDGIEVTRTTPMALTGNSLRLVSSHGIEVIAADSPLVEDNEVVGARLSGIRFSPAAGAQTTGAVVRGNRVEDSQNGLSAVAFDDGVIEGNVLGLAGHHGLSLQLARRTIVRDNDVFASGQVEIVSGQQSEDVVVEHNRLSVREDGVMLDRDTRTTVRANTILAGAHEAIVATGSTAALIEENAIDGAAVAVRLTGGTTDSVVRNNASTTDLWGISVEGGSADNLVHDNTIASSETESAASTIQFGLNVSGESHNNVLRDNHVPAAKNGIEVSGASRFTVLEGNRVAATFFDGIRIEQSAEDTAVRDNVVETAARAGIGVWDGSDRTVVEGNTVLHAEDVAVSVLGANDLVFRNNTIGDAPVGFRSEGSCFRALSRCDAARNLVVSNRFTSIGTTALLVAPASKGGGHTTDLTVTDNILSGTGTAIDLSEAISFVASGNNIDGFATGLSAKTSGEVDARHNWWGAADGPSGAGPGSGAAIVSDGASTVLFDPWLTEPNPSAG